MLLEICRSFRQNSFSFLFRLKCNCTNLLFIEYTLMYLFVILVIIYSCQFSLFEYTLITVKKLDCQRGEIKWNKHDLWNTAIDKTNISVRKKRGEERNWNLPPWGYINWWSDKIMEVHDVMGSTKIYTGASGLETLERWCQWFNHGLFPDLRIDCEIMEHGREHTGDVGSWNTNSKAVEPTLDRDETERLRTPDLANIISTPYDFAVSTPLN